MALEMRQEGATSIGRELWARSMAVTRAGASATAGLATSAVARTVPGMRRATSTARNPQRSRRWGCAGRRGAAVTSAGGVVAPGHGPVESGGGVTGPGAGAMASGKSGESATAPVVAGSAGGVVGILIRTTVPGSDALSEQ